MIDLMEYSALFSMMWPVTSTLVLVTAFLAFLLIKVPRTYLLKFLGIPALLFFAYFSFMFYSTTLGRAAPIPLPDEFVLLGYQSVGTKSIDIWLGLGDGRTRLYVVPYREKTQEQLEKAMKQYKKTGKPQMGKKGPGQGRGKGGAGDFDFEFYSYDFERQHPKQNLPDYP